MSPWCALTVNESIDMHNIFPFCVLSYLVTLHFPHKLSLEYEKNIILKHYLVVPSNQCNSLKLISHF